MRADEASSDVPFEASQPIRPPMVRASAGSPVYDLERAIPEIIAYEKPSGPAQEKPAQLPRNVLITSASKKVRWCAPYKMLLTKLHPECKVIAGDIDNNALTRYVSDEFWKMPRIADGEAHALIAACRERNIRTIFPSRDGELLFWQRSESSSLQHGIDVVVSAAEAVCTCLDKLAFAEFGNRQGLPFIPAAEHPDALGNGPFVVKERYGAGSRKIGLNLDRTAALEHARQLEHPIYHHMYRDKK